MTFGVITGPSDTHRPLLGLAVERTTGPVLELGMGYGSTLLLREATRAAGRKLWSFDSNPDWFHPFATTKAPHHLMAVVMPSWDAVPIEAQHWGVALVDHAPAHRRVTDIRRLADRCDVLVIHDTESSLYGYDEVWPLFKFRLDDCRLRVHTTLVSNRVDVSAWSLPRIDQLPGM